MNKFSFVQVLTYCIDSMPTIIDIPDNIKEEDVTDYISDESGWRIES